MVLWEVREINKDSKGMFAKEPIRGGWMLYPFSAAKEAGTRSKFTVQSPGRKHYVSEFLSLINHSCEPNLKVYEDGLYTLQDIKPDEMLTFDYMDSEDFIASPFKCNCGSKKCVGIVGKPKVGSTMYEEIKENM